MKKEQIRKFKYGGAAVAFTVAFVAVIIILNVIFSALSSRFTLYADMTKAKMYGISDTTKELLSDFTDDVKIVFCTPLDKLGDNKYSSMIYTLAQAYSSEFSNISIDYMNWETETERAQKYKTTAGSTINSRSVIVDCPSRNQCRVYSWDSFIAYTSDGAEYGFNGELKFTSALLQITGDNPSVCFTTNHSEDIKGASALMSLFESAGFTVNLTDLTKDEIPQDAKVIVIYGPKTDFFGADSVYNEFEKIDSFIASYGHMMVFLSPEAGELPELNEYLHDNWYIDVSNETVKDTPENTLSDNGLVISAQYATDDSPGAALTKELRSLGNAPKAVVPSSLALSTARGGDSDTKSVNASYVLKSSDGATAIGKENTTGEFGLVMLSAKIINTEGENHDGYLLVSGSCDFAGEGYISSSTYANKDILYAAMKSMGKDKVPANIDVRKFESSSLDITTSQANNWTIVFSVAIPTIFAALGLIVYIRRKHL